MKFCLIALKKDFFSVSVPSVCSREILYTRSAALVPACSAQFLVSIKIIPFSSLDQSEIHHQLSSVFSASQKDFCTMKTQKKISST